MSKDLQAEERAEQTKAKEDAAAKAFITVGLAAFLHVFKQRGVPDCFADAEKFVEEADRRYMRAGWRKDL